MPQKASTFPLGQEQLQPGREMSETKDIASKIAENAARLAACFHIYCDDGLKNKTINEDSMKKACIIAKWHLYEGRRFLKEIALPVEISNATKLESWLIGYCNKNNLKILPLRVVQRLGPVRDRTLLVAAIEVLVDVDHVKFLQEGRKKNVLINPKLLEVKKITQNNWANYQKQETKIDTTSVANVANVAVAVAEDLKIPTNNTVYKNSIIVKTDKDLNSKSEFVEVATATATFATNNTASIYANQQMLESGLTTEGILDKGELHLELGDGKLNDLLNKGKEKQNEEDEGDTTFFYDKLTPDQKLKIIEHVIISFNKFFLGDHYSDQKPNEMFLKAWLEVNSFLGIEKILNCSVELIRLAENAKANGNATEFKRLHNVSENAELFRKFCLEEFRNFNYHKKSPSHDYRVSLV